MNTANYHTGREFRGRSHGFVLGVGFQEEPRDPAAVADRGFDELVLAAAFVVGTCAHQEHREEGLIAVDFPLTAAAHLAVALEAEANKHGAGALWIAAVDQARMEQRDLSGPPCPDN